MPGRHYFSEELLRGISDGEPAGHDLRHDPLFSEILEARRADDSLNVGAWEKAEGKKRADWNRAADLCLSALKDQTKDLRLAGFLVEAAVNLDGFNGLQQSLQLSRELIVRFWHLGLHPSAEDGDLDFRAASLGWLDNKLPEMLANLPLTDRGGRRDENFSWAHYQQARRIGTETAIAGGSAELRETVAGLRSQGWITMDAFEAAMNSTPRAALEGIQQPFEAAYAELLELNRTLDEFFGQDAPSFSKVQEMFEEIRKVLLPALKKKQEGVDGTPPAPKPSEHGGQILIRDPDPVVGGPANDPWEAAQGLVHGGKVELGLAQMAALASAETTGRSRFLRKLALVDVCLQANRERLAKTILKELNEQVKEYKLDAWESSALAGAVWSRLYRLYRNSDISREQEEAVLLYNQISQLDPWQTFLNCED